MNWPSFSVTILKIHGMRVRLHAVFLLVLAIYWAADRLPEAILSFGIVLLHECGHLLAARFKGYRALEIVMLPIGGVLNIHDRLKLTPSIEGTIAAAGPATNLLLLALGFASRPLQLIPEPWLTLYIQTNLMVFSFNLLPILPLDGGRILRALLSPALGFRRATARVVSLGRFATLLMLLLGGLLIWLGELPLSLILMALMLYQATAREGRDSAYTLVNHLAAKQADLGSHRILELKTLAVDDQTPLGEVSKRLVAGRYHLLYVIRGGRVICEITEQQLLAGLVQLGPQALLKELL